jgi:hypothetical protein
MRALLVSRDSYSRLLLRTVAASALRENDDLMRIHTYHHTQQQNFFKQQGPSEDVEKLEGRASMGLITGSLIRPPPACAGGRVLPQPFGGGRETAQGERVCVSAATTLNAV